MRAMMMHVTLFTEVNITGMGACGQGYMLVGLSGTSLTEWALGKGGTALGGVPPFPKILDLTEWIAISLGDPPI